MNFNRDVTLYLSNLNNKIKSINFIMYLKMTIRILNFLYKIIDYNSNLSKLIYLMSDKRGWLNHRVHQWGH